MIMTEPTGAPGYATPSRYAAGRSAGPPDECHPGLPRLGGDDRAVPAVAGLRAHQPDLGPGGRGRAAHLDVNGVQIGLLTLVNTAEIIRSIPHRGRAVPAVRAFEDRDGRNWARVVLTIIGVLGVLSALLPSYRSVTVNGTTFVVQNYGIHWISLALLVAALVLMFRARLERLFHHIEGVSPGSP